MSDPRYRNGIHKSTTRRPPVQLDSPTRHGWQRAGVSDTTGYTLYSLGAAQMRCTTPRERATWPYDWIARIGKDYYGFTGSLAEITCEIKTMLQAEEPAR